MKILNFGSCNIDYVYSLDHIVGVGDTETTYMLETFPGGKGLNQSMWELDPHPGVSVVTRVPEHNPEASQ